MPPEIEARIITAVDNDAFKLARPKNLSVKNYLGHRAFSTWTKWWEMPRHTDRSAYACGTLPLLAWNLSHSYDRVLIANVDTTCLKEDPLPWMVQNKDAYLIGANDRSDDWSGKAPRRAYDGIDDSSLLYLQPDAQIYDLMIESGQTGSYIPFAGTARDIIETLFPAHTLPSRLCQSIQSGRAAVASAAAAALPSSHSHSQQ